MPYWLTRKAARLQVFVDNITDGHTHFLQRHCRARGTVTLPAEQSSRMSKPMSSCSRCHGCCITCCRANLSDSTDEGRVRSDFAKPVFLKPSLVWITLLSCSTSSCITSSKLSAKPVAGFDSSRLSDAVGQKGLNFSELAATVVGRGPAPVACSAGKETFSVSFTPDRVWSWVLRIASITCSFGRRSSSA